MKKKMEQPKKYYSVVGYNGVVVADNIPQLNAARRYIKHAEVIEFDNFLEAEAHALVVFNGNLESIYYPLHYLTVNHAMYKKNLIRTF